MEGNIVVITGGSSGIGLCYTILAQSQKAKKIIIADISLSERAQEVIDTDDNVVYQECDVTKWNDLQALVDFSKEEFGDVPDVYVASAGVLEPVNRICCLSSDLNMSDSLICEFRQPHSNFWHDPESLEADGYAQVDININHPIKLTRLAIRGLLGSNKPGVVVLLGSTAGYAKQYLAPIYSATKHAITGFTKSMGDAEKYQGVRVVAVCPGIVSTPQWTTGAPAERFKRMEGIAVTPESVAQAIHEVVTQPAKYPGGTVLEVLSVGSRIVPEWHIAPPGVNIPAEAIATGLKPIFEVTAAERRGHKEY
ncbi:hypothetical protein B0J13DRAFT_528053 [Dactylonectria estremocensis]|uniref:NAD(P)-binding protein n=1 Tax=Dactylonectria estremocensis TaxID=1079267 RepID=A0A9P9IVT5_9HYPO|nr:hypothetical protein B0J13DRAFT_528053 [Dactylonectria estremocensis]